MAVYRQAVLLDRLLFAVKVSFPLTDSDLVGASEGKKKAHAEHIAPAAPLETVEKHLKLNALDFHWQTSGSSLIIITLRPPAEAVVITDQPIDFTYHRLLASELMSTLEQI